MNKENQLNEYAKNIHGYSVDLMLKLGRITKKYQLIDDKKEGYTEQALNESLKILLDSLVDIHEEYSKKLAKESYKMLVGGN